MTKNYNDFLCVIFCVTSILNMLFLQYIFIFFVLKGPREQLNQATHWVDGSVVYGSTKEDMDRLRDFSDRGQGSRSKTIFCNVRHAQYVTSFCIPSNKCKIGALTFNFCGWHLQLNPLERPPVCKKHLPIKMHFSEIPQRYIYIFSKTSAKTVNYYTGTFNLIVHVPWCVKWGLLINKEKSKVLHFRRIGQL